MTKLRNHLGLYWDLYKKDQRYLSQHTLTGWRDHHRGRIEVLKMILEEKVTDYYDGGHVGSENRAHAEMVLEILGVY